MQNKMRKELIIGLACLTLCLVLKQFSSVSDFVIGILMGSAISFELIGILPEKLYLALKNWKKAILHRS
ncbi:MAG: hypothetical protein JG769_2 [Oscillospiraceae bacterium]|jgi:hypothetical protein|nr:hypothetical protein [Oscillospiraceae bacterium]